MSFNFVCRHCRLVSDQILLDHTAVALTDHGKVSPTVFRAETLRPDKEVVFEGLPDQDLVPFRGHVPVNRGIRLGQLALAIQSINPYR